ncbi:MAG: type II secretion system protein GspD, partial [Deltaproteobacteria bacterium]|nr:type II secretion system protein GspD [Deltaproteobacteria bacterium]
MNFKDAEIEQVVKFISDLTGRNFILDEKVRGKITVISPSQLTIEEAYQVFQAILEVKGFTVVPTGKVLKIVATRDAKQTSIETIRDAAPPGDRYVTRILRLRYIDASVAASILAPLVSKDGSVVPYAPTNSLIITDAYNNIERLQEILTAFDVETQETVLETVRIQYASAETVAKLLLQAFAEKARAASPAVPRRGPAAAGTPAPGAAPVGGEAAVPKIIPDSRTNSLIIIADPTTLQDMKRMIQILDVEAQKGSGKINVYYLKYADADNIASVLTA